MTIARAGALIGIHHVTAIGGDPQANVDFYTGVLGLRLVKRTVNQDAPDTYHLFYGDTLGHPGTELTFFAWPGARRGREGAGQAVAVALAIPLEATGRSRSDRSTTWRGGPLPQRHTADEEPAALGGRLVLPPWLEPQRALIEDTLPPIQPPATRT